VVDLKEVVKQGSKSNLLLWVLVFLLVLILGTGIFLVGMAFFAAGTKTTEKPAISVSGEGKIRAKPDLAILSVGIVTEADTVAEAQSQNNTIADKVKAAIKAQGVEEKDISTSRYNIYPVGTPYPVPVPLREGKEVSGSEGATVTSEIVGERNRVDNFLEIKVRKVENVGKVIDAATAAGATNIESIYFSIEEKDKFLAQARELAGKDARAKAEQLAKSMGVTLGKLLKVEESSSWPRPIYYTAQTLKEGGTEISTGELDVIVNITAEYEIR